MTTSVRTPECYPEAYVLFPGWKAEPADHGACPGGFTVDGVRGGWHCPCPCHGEVAA